MLLRRPLKSAQYAAEPYRACWPGTHPAVHEPKGNCLDNAPMESFFGRLKKEHVHRTPFPTREAAKRAAVFEYRGGVLQSFITTHISLYR